VKTRLQPLPLVLPYVGRMPFFRFFAGAKIGKIMISDRVEN